MTNRALLLIDVQRGFLNTSPKALMNLRSASENTTRLLTHARERGEAVVHVQNVPAITGLPLFAQGHDAVGMGAKLQPKRDEPVVFKRNANPFSETDLNSVLREQRVEEVALCGALSHLCVDTAARAAHELGYRVSVIHDACATHELNFRGMVVPAEQVHAAFMAALEAAVARIVTTREFIDGPEVKALRRQN